MRRMAILLLVCALPGAGGCAGRAGRAGTAPLSAEVRADDPAFVLAGRREVPVTYTLANLGGGVRRFEFPTGQRFELVLRGPGGRRLFLWSEDRLFEDSPSVVLINPGERVEHRAVIPTRDMAAGVEYTVEGVLPGHPETSATAGLRPR